MRLWSALVLAAASLSGQSLPRAEEYLRAHDYQSANNEFRALVAANPKNAQYRVRWGRLFLERFQPGDATKLFQEALTLDPNSADAMLGMAEALAAGFSPEATKFANLALEKNPKLYQAHELKARLALEDNDNPEAVREADAALAISPDASDALAVRAAIDWLEDRDGGPWIARALARHPRDGKPYSTVGYFFVMNRRYEEGIGYYRKAIQVQPDLLEAHAELGINLMRQGREEEARKELEFAYNQGQKSAPVVNSLRLIDSYSKFETIRDGNIILKLNKKEAEVLRPYFAAELKRAVATYEKKYGWKLNGPVQLEVYPDHEDFAVRTLGIPGLGALGVTFGNVVAMDSPSGRVPGSFHWASVLWHELSHVYTLSMTAHRVPRWFTEGVAVHEETAASPDWGDRLTPDAIDAIKKKELLKVAELDRGFIHPKKDKQVLVSYFEGGQICDFIAKQWGEQKLVDITHAFAKNSSTKDVIEKQLGISADEFDKRFLADLEARTKTTVDHFEEWNRRAKELHELDREKRYDEILAKGPAVRDLYTDYVEQGSIYELIAKAQLETHHEAAAADELVRYWHAGGRDPKTLKQLSDLLALKRPAEAIQVLESLIYIAPLDPQLHQKLGDLYLAQHRTGGAVREYQAIIAAKPLDVAGAHFHLAQAYHAAGKTEQTKDELLQSLEAAPGFRPAQKMLLEISGK